MNIDLLKDSARVRASYEVDQVPNEGDSRVWKGKVEWVLIKEHGDLKISRLSYLGGETPQLSTSISKPVAGSPASAPRPPSSAVQKEEKPSSLMQEEEVRRFLSTYVERYNQRDIDGFLSLFSPKVIQNRKDGIEKIRKAYTQLFSESEKLTYQVRDTKIDPLRETARVWASYEIEQVLKAGGVRTWKGDIEWLLMKEAGDLKISTIQYRYDRVR